ncbi:MAG: DUF4351 domain-containing protein [Acidobacteriota bacterium]|nr:DUF4351 domain-containing protein [Acidobacteriota bacterium]
MREYDATLKMLLRGSAARTLRDLTGVSVAKWLDIELPKVHTLLLDLLGQTADESLIHLELQSRNDPEMPLRMAEYALGVYRLFGKFPRQIVLYVGESPLRMVPQLEGPEVLFRYEVVDIRDLDGERLLASERVGDNVIAILTRLRDREGAIHEIVRKISELEGSERELALRQLVTLGGLRRLEEVIEREARKMPLLDDIMDNKVLGREYKRGLQEGVQEGMQQGVREGMQQGVREGMRQGELTLLRRLIEKRFGAVPAWAEEWLSRRPPAELEALGVRLLDAKSVEDLLPHTHN